MREQHISFLQKSQVSSSPPKALFYKLFKKKHRLWRLFCNRKWYKMQIYRRSQCNL